MPRAACRGRRLGGFAVNAPALLSCLDILLLKNLDTMSRREKILAMLADDPTDTFLRYSLAMEYRGEKNTAESLLVFDGLIRDDPPYVPAFFMAAQLLADVSRVDESRTMLRSGIEEARRQGDHHAAAEMSELLASLGRLGESVDSADDDL